ncbi:MAG: hypothetical protein J6575_05765 [Bifidobacterium sp.]|nr:hypothetical protein [Bifidobacterium sp.]
MASVTAFPSILAVHIPLNRLLRTRNEIRNEQIRRYSPKGTDFSDFDQQDIDAIRNEINDRLMKVLGGLSPAQAFGLELDRMQSDQQCCTSKLNPGNDNQTSQ